MKNNKSRIVLAIIGGVVVVGAITVALIHFWEDIKNLLPNKNEEEDFVDFEEIAE